jgi:hypothetical protein
MDRLTGFQSRTKIYRRLKMKKKTLEGKALEITYLIPEYFVLIKAPHPSVSGEIFFDTDPEAIEVVREAYEEYRRKKREKEKK